MVAASEKQVNRRAVIVTALPVEYAAVRAHLRDLREQVDERGTVFEIGVFDAAGGDWEVAIAQIGIGSIGAAITAERAILQFRPGVLLLVGIAGGISNEVSVGDDLAVYEFKGHPVAGRICG